jgi:hypothetical protein
VARMVRLSADRRRRDRGGRARGAVQPQETRSAPSRALAYCLSEAGVTLEHADYGAFYAKPFSSSNACSKSHGACTPRGLARLSESMPVRLKHLLRGELQKIALELRSAQAPAVRRTPHRPCGRPPITPRHRRCRGADAGRGRGMVHDLGWDRTWQPTQHRAQTPFSPFNRLFNQLCLGDARSPSLQKPQSARQTT